MRKSHVEKIFRPLTWLMVNVPSLIEQADSSQKKSDGSMSENWYFEISMRKWSVTETVLSSECKLEFR